MVAAAADLPAELGVVRLPPSGPHPAQWPAWVPAHVRETLAATGIEQPFEHQVQGAELVWAGRDVAIATGTASGKSLAYLLPILAATADGDPTPPTALYIAPTKALARDQLRRLEEVAVPGLRVAAYDGDTPAEERRWARRHATAVVTNPDMLHRGILPGHEAWQSFLRRLRFVVVDEFHVYRGLFGAHLAAVLRRLLRLARRYGAEPVVIGASATAASPGRTLATLTGRPAAEIAGESGSRAGALIGLVPPGEDGLISRTTEVFAELLRLRVPTIAFVRSRRAAEAVSQLTADKLADDPDAAGRVAPYRSGYLPEERRELERQLRSGELLGVAATSALELGIDITGLDAVLVAGWPGTRAALRQRIGRAGRADTEALALFLAEEDPLDTYLVSHPDALLDTAEAVVIDQANPYVLAPHLCAAAGEAPLTDEEAREVFGPEALELLPVLAERGLLRRRATGWYWTRPDRPSDLTDLRGIVGQPVSVVEEGTGRLIASVDRSSADRTVHAGAVYTHLGSDYLITGLDLADGVATAHRARLGYTTVAQSEGQTRVLERLAKQSWGRITVCFGVVEVTSRVTSFLKRRNGTGQILGVEPLDLPEHTLRTKAVWWEIPDDVLMESGVAAADVAGAAHAAEHAAIGMLPLFANCDRWDIGGLSTAAHPDTGMCTIFVHDGHPGGAGFAERGYGAAAEWLRHTAEAIAGCPCERGCPRCVQSPKCGSGNDPLSKAGAVALLSGALAAAPVGSSPAS